VKNVLLVGVERPGTHYDALAVTRQHQQVTGLTLGWEPLGVGLDVDGGPVGELLELSFPDFLAGGPPDRQLGLVERFAVSAPQAA